MTDQTPPRLRHVSATDALRRWAEARDLWRFIRDARDHIGRCEWRDEDTQECVRSELEPSDYCDVCAARDLLYPALNLARKAERQARARVGRCVDRDRKQEIARAV